MRSLRAALAALALLAGAGAVAAQDARLPEAAPSRLIVVLDREALYARSRYGTRVRAETEAALRALATENRRIEAELEAEERALTERRTEEEAAAFRDLARAFDARVEAIRREQETKERAIADGSERAQAAFFEAAGPILTRLARDLGALVVLDRRTVIASADGVDITAAALAAVDREIGAGPVPDADPAAAD